MPRCSRSSRSRACSATTRAVRRVEQVAQQVHADRPGGGAGDGGELGTADHRQAGGPGGQRRLPAAGVVVIGDRDDVEPGGHRGGHQFGRGVRSVGGRGVGVQVDEHRVHPACRGRETAAGPPTHRGRPASATFIAAVTRRLPPKAGHGYPDLCRCAPVAAGRSRRRPSEGGRHGSAAFPAVVAVVHPHRPQAAGQIDPAATDPIGRDRRLRGLCRRRPHARLPRPVAAPSNGSAREGRGFVWIGLHEPDTDEMTEVAELFGLHELAVEDAVHAYQRPKMDRYDDRCSGAQDRLLRRAHRPARRSRSCRTARS